MHRESRPFLSIPRLAAYRQRTQLGSVVIALNGPSEQSVGQITEFQKLFLAPGFLVYGSILIAAALVIIFYFAPR